jgi:hypothetical protein
MINRSLLSHSNDFCDSLLSIRLCHQVLGLCLTRFALHRHRPVKSGVGLVRRVENEIQHVLVMCCKVMDLR